jgi:hypothetical protein
MGDQQAKMMSRSLPTAARLAGRRATAGIGRDYGPASWEGRCMSWNDKGPGVLQLMP